MMRFSEKISELPLTLRESIAADQSRLTEALQSSSGRPALAVGSGGSAVTAAYFSRCRETLAGDITIVMTPMELVLGAGDLDKMDVWLFSAGADNADFRAALQAAQNRRARHIHILTRRPDALATLGLHGSTRVSVHTVPVSSAKDSFLATHSLASSVTALLMASNAISRDPTSYLPDAFITAAEAVLAEDQRRIARKEFSSLQADNTLLIVADPQLRAIASLLETCAWEASLCSVQSTDFRNFAHGRHTWVHHRPDSTVVLALSSHDTREVWFQSSKVLPSEVRRINVDFENCGRFQNALGLIRALTWVEAMGEAVGIDPGKPGIGEFGRTLFADTSLEQLSDALRPAVRQKRRAKLERDDPVCSSGGIYDADRQRLTRLATATIGGIVLDYDGTIVSTEKRTEPPAANLVDELARLHRLGVRLAIATGRGGSAGESLRDVLPPEMHANILMGYYNGGYMRFLEVNIDDDPPERDPEIVRTAAWLGARDYLFLSPIAWDRCRVQIMIQLNNIRNLPRFQQEVASCDSVSSGKVRITRSGHSLDIIPATSSKINVADRVAEGLAADVAVLRLGDQGGRNGNDNELLTHPHGISVMDVCGRDDGCWSLFGNEVTGPDALLRLLRSLQPNSEGEVRLDVGSLGLHLDPHEYK